MVVPEGEPCRRKAVEQALDIAQRDAYYATRVGWSLVRAQVRRRLGSGMSVTESLEPLWATLNDRHSHVRPTTPEVVGSRSVQVLPDGGDLGSGVGYLRLPAVRLATVGKRGAVEYVRAARRVMARLPAPRGWVVDVRGNTGGMIHPILAAAGPLLGPAVFLSYRRRTGWGARFSHGPHGLVVNDRIVLPAPPAMDLTGLPVALLQDGRTASSGEGTVVAFRGRPRTATFGSPTFGVPTGNTSYRLAGGWTLVLTVSVATDRNGDTYEGPLSVEYSVTEPEQIIARANTWLASQVE